MTGISVIIASTCIGIAWKYFRSYTKKTPSLIEFYLLGIVVHIVMLICMLWLPCEMAVKVLSKISLPVMIIYPATTAILGKLILNSEYRKKAEKEIRKSEEHQRAIITASPFAIITLTPGGLVKIWNRAAEVIFGWTEKEATGRYLPIVPDDGRKAYEALCRQIMNGDTFSNIELIRLRKDGTLVDVRLSVTPIREKGDSINAIMAVYEDITAQKKAENDKKRLQAQLTQAQKMESVGRLAGGVAHDYNNMLSIILGYTEMALEEVTPDSRLHSDLQQILAAAKHSTDITAQLLAFSRQQTIAPKNLNLNDTIESMLESLGYKVLEAKRPDEAIAKAAEYSNKIHLLITDVIMPDMNGHQLSEELRTAYPDIKILFTSGYTSDVIANRGILYDGVNFLPKPFSKKDLALKVREVIGNVH